jgi:hypothetical protein
MIDSKGKIGQNGKLIFSACKVLILQNEKGLGISGITE